MRTLPSTFLRRPTMGDVAARAGVSPKSVSRVVNAEPYVSDDVTARVRLAIAELGYRPDRRARALAAMPSSERLVGFVQVDAANPFFAAVNRGVEDATRERGLMVVTGSTDADAAREVALVETLIELRVEGLVVAAAEGSDDLLRREIRQGTPVVCVDRVLPGGGCDTVVSSNRTSTAAAVRHLRDLGHRRIAFLGGNQDVWTARERLSGYCDAHEDTPPRLDPRLVMVGVDTERLAAAAVHRLLADDDPPTALLTAQDRITIGAVTALHDLGRHHDVAVIGYDEIPLSAQLDPPVAVVAQDPYAMGQRAGALLLDRLAGRLEGPGRRVVLEAPLVLRASAMIRPTG